MFQVTLPNNIGTLQNPVSNPQLVNLAGLVSGALNIALILAGFLMLAWMSWGVFQYIFAGGNKESLAKARGRLIYAVVGFLMVVIAFSVSRYVQDFFPTSQLFGPGNPGPNNNVTTVTEPK